MAKNKSVFLVDKLKKTVEKFTFGPDSSEYDINRVFMNMKGHKYFQSFSMRYEVVEFLTPKHKKYKMIAKD
ncbi:MAG: hypothetical protein ACRDD8_14150, partial [Bacteroidales bacterium]